MSDEPNLKAMTQAELLKYLEDDFMPRLLPKLANFQNLESENARLKDEVEHLGAFRTHTIIPNEILKAENARLKAEVERLTERLNRHLEINDELDARCTRLRKAGDAMAETLEGAGFDSAMDFWNAAKEGKPSV